MNFSDAQPAAPSPRQELRHANWQQMFMATAIGSLVAAASAGALVFQDVVCAGIVALTIGLAATLFMLRHPKAMLWILICTTPFNEHLNLKIGIRPFGFIVILGTIWMTWLYFSKQKTRYQEIAAFLTRDMIIVLLLFLAKMLSIYCITVMPDTMTKGFCYKYMILLLLQFAAAFLTAIFIDSKELLYQILRAWTHMTNIVTLVAILHIIISNTTRWELVVHRDIVPFGRPFSVFREPDVLGCFYAAFIVLLIPLMVAGVDFISRGYMWFSLFFNGLFFLIVSVRAGWVSSMLCFAIYIPLVMLTGKFRRFMPYVNMSLVAGGFLLLALLTLAPTALEKIAGRFQTISDPKKEGGSAYRIMELGYQYNMVFHPTVSDGGNITYFVGRGDFSWSHWGPPTVGPDNFIQEAKNLPKGEVMINAGYNVLLTWMFDNGIIGLSLYCIFFLSLTLSFLRSLYLTQDAGLQALLMGTYFSVLSTLICYIFSYDPLYLSFWVQIGICYAAIYHVNRIESGIDEIGIPEPA